VTLDKRTVALGIAAVAAVAAAVSVTAINHKSHGSRERRDVAAYITRVNAVQNRMHAPLTRVMLAYRQFAAKGGAKKTAASKLGDAARTLERLDRKLIAIPAPPEAAKLRKLLIGLVGGQAVLTREVQKMATFSPRFTTLLAAVRAANTQLSTALSAVKGPTPHKLRGTRKAVLAAQQKYQAESAAAAAAQADAVDAYVVQIRDVVRRLRLLRPPGVLTPGYRAQVQALRDVVSAGGKLSAELRKTDRRRVPILGRKFTLASREAQSVAAQKTQISAIRTYNARARAISAAAGRVQDELLRLQRTLP
jgi:hypothetical protein